MPPARPSTRSAKLMGLGYPGGPALSRLAEQGDADGFRAAAAAAAQRRPRLLVRRPEDRGADAGCEAGRSNVCEHAARRHGGQRRRRRSSTCWCEVDARAGANGAASASWWPAAWAPTPSCARGSTRACASARRARALPRAGAVHRQRRDDRAGRGDAAASGHRGSAERTTPSTSGRAGAWQKRRADCPAVRGARRVNPRDVS